MKYKRKYICLLLAVIFALSLQFPVMASTAYESQSMQYDTIQPFWVNVSNAFAILRLSGTTAHCSATITGLSGTTRISATMTLERVSGSNVVWSTSWTQTVNSSRLVMSQSATVTSNGTYRLRVDATVTRNGVAEEISFTG